ncbi:MAG: 23S rRNA (pseudouridine(1915)-N(3))-methyltransferase RlmH [Oscillospiraceae bacterium]|nr:23S rRNA (pseudouridine(1915)-N(3))-methyltransferase RlmH [Oscillospiraceae bacterium]
MQAVTILCVGKLKEAYWRDAAAEYQKRLGPFCKLSVVEIEEERSPQNPSLAQTDAVMEAEGRRILSKIPEGSFVVAMCIEGGQKTSQGLAQLLEDAALKGKSAVTFVIGGSFGLSPAVKARADQKLSMSGMTFPHQLARVMLLEQVYRGYQILNGGKYHK